MQKHFLSFLIFLSFTTLVFAGESNLDLLSDNLKTYKNIKVDKVLSADTIRLDNDEYVKLIGLQAPEAPKRTSDITRDEHGFIVKPKVNPEDPIEEQALAFTKGLLEKQYVRLEFDTNKKSDDFKTFAYVFLVKDNTFANAEILRQGYANLSLSPPNTKYADQLRAAYKEARREKKGLQGE